MTDKQGWAGKGSTRRWRELRLKVLRRDGWVCQLCGEDIPRHLRHPDPRSASVHHLVGKRYGDDPSTLAASHLVCNLKVGDPSRPNSGGGNQHDPDPDPLPWNPQP